MRGGTSRGPYFKASDLPSDIGDRDRVLLSVMGSPHPMQVDGIGGTYIARVKEVQAADPAADPEVLSALSRQLASSISGDLTVQLRAALRRDTDVTINPAILDELF